MYWHCEIGDKMTIEEFRNNHLQSRFHKRSANSIIRKYINTSPKPNKINDKIRKYVRLHYKKYEKFPIVLLVKLSIPSNQNKNFNRQYPCHRDQECVNNAFFFSKIKIFKEQLCYQIIELRITFVSRFENITFDHYITKAKSMLKC